jgi:trigger factor
VAVTVRSVKEKELPELDDEFAEIASEFDTLDELRSDVRERLSRVRALEQGAQARDKVLESLLAATDVPLPESIVRGEVEWRQHDIGHQLEGAGLDLDAYLSAEGRTREDFEAEVQSNSETAVKSQLVLDAIADAEQVGISDTELTEHVIMQAQQYGVSPQEFAQQMTEAGNLPALVADVRRNKALALVMDRATVTDESGNRVDLSALRRPAPETVTARDGEADDEEAVPAATAASAVADPTSATSIRPLGS